MCPLSFEVYKELLKLMAKLTLLCCATLTLHGPHDDGPYGHLNLKLHRFADATYNLPNASSAAQMSTSLTSQALRAAKSAKFALELNAFIGKNGSVASAVQLAAGPEDIASPDSAFLSHPVLQLGSPITDQDWKILPTSHRVLL